MNWNPRTVLVPIEQGPSDAGVVEAARGLVEMEGATLLLAAVVANRFIPGGAPARVEVEHVGEPMPAVIE
jgi:hypothetical protein